VSNKWSEWFFIVGLPTGEETGQWTDRSGCPSFARSETWGWYCDEYHQWGPSICFYPELPHFNVCFKMFS